MTRRNQVTVSFTNPFETCNFPFLPGENIMKLTQRISDTLEIPKEKIELKTVTEQPLNNNDLASSMENDIIMASIQPQTSTNQRLNNNYIKPKEKLYNSLYTTNDEIPLTSNAFYVYKCFDKMNDFREIEPDFHIHYDKIKDMKSNQLKEFITENCYYKYQSFLDKGDLYLYLSGVPFSSDSISVKQFYELFPNAHKSIEIILSGIKIENKEFTKSYSNICCFNYENTEGPSSYNHLLTPMIEEICLNPFDIYQILYLHSVGEYANILTYIQFHGLKTQEIILSISKICPFPPMINALLRLIHSSEIDGRTLFELGSTLFFLILGVNHKNYFSEANTKEYYKMFYDSWKIFAWLAELDFKPCSNDYYNHFQSHISHPNFIPASQFNFTDIKKRTGDELDSPLLNILFNNKGYKYLPLRQNSLNIWLFDPILNGTAWCSCSVSKVFNPDDKYENSPLAPRSFLYLKEFKSTTIFHSWDKYNTFIYGMHHEKDSGETYFLVNDPMQKNLALKSILQISNIIHRVNTSFLRNDLFYNLYHHRGQSYNFNPDKPPKLMYLKDDSPIFNAVSVSASDERIKELVFILYDITKSMIDNFNDNNLGISRHDVAFIALSSFADHAQAYSKDQAFLLLSFDEAIKPNSKFIEETTYDPDMFRNKAGTFFKLTKQNQETEIFYQVENAINYFYPINPNDSPLKHFPNAKLRLLLITDGIDEKFSPPEKHNDKKEIIRNLINQARKNNIIIDSVVVSPKDKDFDPGVSILSKYSGGYCFCSSSIEDYSTFFDSEIFFDRKKRDKDLKLPSLDDFDNDPGFSNPLIIQQFKDNLPRPEPKLKTPSSEPAISLSDAVLLPDDGKNAKKNILHQLKIIFSEIKNENLKWLEVYPQIKDIRHWDILINTKDTEDGVWWRLDCQLSDEYPKKPPTLTMLFPPLNPNISSGGFICHPILSTDYTAKVTMLEILKKVRDILIEPNPRHCLKFQSIIDEYRHYDDGMHEFNLKNMKEKEMEQQRKYSYTNSKDWLNDENNPNSKHINLKKEQNVDEKTKHELKMIIENFKPPPSEFINPLVPGEFFDRPVKVIIENRKSSTDNTIKYFEEESLRIIKRNPNIKSEIFGQQFSIKEFNNDPGVDYNLRRQIISWKKLHKDYFIYDE